MVCHRKTQYIKNLHTFSTTGYQIDQFSAGPFSAVSYRWKQLMWLGYIHHMTILLPNSKYHRLLHGMTSQHSQIDIESNNQPKPFVSSAKRMEEDRRMTIMPLHRQNSRRKVVKICRFHVHHGETSQPTGYLLDTSQKLDVRMEQALRHTS